MVFHCTWKQLWIISIFRICHNLLCMLTAQAVTVKCSHASSAFDKIQHIHRIYLLNSASIAISIVSGFYIGENISATFPSLSVTNFADKNAVTPKDVRHRIPVIP